MDQCLKPAWDKHACSSLDEASFASTATSAFDPICQNLLVLLPLWTTLDLLPLTPVIPPWTDLIVLLTMCSCLWSSGNPGIILLYFIFSEQNKNQIFLSGFCLRMQRQEHRMDWVGRLNLRNYCFFFLPVIEIWRTSHSKSMPQTKRR